MRATITRVSIDAMCAAADDAVARLDIDETATYRYVNTVWEPGNPIETGQGTIPGAELRAEIRVCLTLAFHDVQQDSPDVIVLRWSRKSRRNNFRTRERVYVRIAPADTDELAVTAPLALLRAAGVRCLPWRDSGGTYVRMPLDDGTEITFAGTEADSDDERGHDVSTRHRVREHSSWQASLTGATDDDFEELYDSNGKGLPYEQDTAAMVAAVIACAHQHGGSHPTAE